MLTHLMAFQAYMSTERLCVCFLEKYRITNNVAIIPSASAMLKYSAKPSSGIYFSHRKIRHVKE